MNDAAVKPCGLYRHPRCDSLFFADFSAIALCRESVRPIIPSDFDFRSLEALDKLLRLDYPVAARVGDPAFEHRLHVREEYQSSATIGGEVFARVTMTDLVLLSDVPTQCSSFCEVAEDD